MNSKRRPGNRPTGRRGRAPEVLGHRGFSARCPENTLASFRAAMECGADGVEFDIQKTADGRFAVIHDDRLERTTNGNGAVREKTMAELKALDAGGGETIPQLGEVLAELAGYEGALINVELKEQNIEVSDAEDVLAVLAPYSGTFRFLISSFEHGLLPPYARRGYRTGLLLGEKHEAAGIRGIRASIRTVRPATLNLPCQIFDRIRSPFLGPVLRLLRLFGPRPAYWTVNTEEDFRRVRPSAVIVISNDPELMLRLLNTRTK
jgi:glycerophosphoryl diester phosphodiesterase